MKKTLLIIISLLFAVGFASAQDVYYAGNQLNTGKVWKNDSLIYSTPDSLNVRLNALKAALDGSLYTAGYSYDTTFMLGHVWKNDSCLFTTDSIAYIDRMLLNDTVWTAAGGNKVWQNGTLLYAYATDSASVCTLSDIAIDSLTGDLYAAGATTDSLCHAVIWKNDSILWMEDSPSCVDGLCFDGQDLYAAGFMQSDSVTDGVIWLNDSVILQVPDAHFSHITVYDSSLYWVGTVEDTFYVFQDGFSIYALPEVYAITDLEVNEFGVYCAVVFDSTTAIWKDGEILYQPEDCQFIMALAVLPTPPLPEFTLTVTVNDTLLGNVLGSGIYPLGDTATIVAIPNIGCEFLYWNDSITDNPLDVVITQDSAFVAYFGLIDYLIETSASPVEAGIVTPGGLYHYGDTLTIEATPNLGYVFDGWHDGIVDNPRDVIVVSDSSFVAQFSILQCAITTSVTPEGAGTVEGGGTYGYGTTIQLTAYNNNGYVFSHWDDGIVDNPRDVLVEGDASYTAVFTPLQYMISTGVNPENGGSVEGGGIYDYGTIATLTAIVSPYFEFLCWSDGSAANPRTITVTGDATFTALFHQISWPDYTLTVLANDPNLGSVSGSGVYTEGTVVEVIATPFGNAIFTGWDDGNADNPRYVTMSQDLTLTALFSLPSSYTILVETPDAMMGSVYGSGTYFVNTVITIGATPNEGYHFTGWDDGNADNPRSVTVTGDAVFTASFSENPVPTYTVTVYYEESQGFVLGAGNYVEGSTATLAAIAADGYVFVKWSDNTTDNPKTIVVDRDIILAAFFNTTAVDENGNAVFSLYPNPAENTIHIEGIEGKTEAQIVNAQGLVVKTLTLNGDADIALDDLTSGLYLLRIGRCTAKFMKR